MWTQPLEDGKPPPVKFGLNEKIDNQTQQELKRQTGKWHKRSACLRFILLKKTRQMRA